MTAKEYLLQVQNLENEIKQKRERIVSIRQLSSNLTSDFNNIPNHSNFFKGFDNIVVKIMDMEEELNDDIHRLFNLKCEIGVLLACLENPTYVTILNLRYLSYMSWKNISEELRLELRWVYRLHVRALEAADKIRHSQAT